MRRLPAYTATVFVAAVLLVTSACGGGGKADAPVLEPNEEEGLSLTLSHSEPLRAKSPVTWTLGVRNAGPEPVTLTFSSGQRGDVVLLQGGAERYRWSMGKAFTQVFGEMTIGPGQVESFELKDDTLDVEPGQYELVASLKSQPSPTEVRQAVTVSG
ncbi:MAG TPA: BsuPI-related putative proteinase inhibitor [Acidimicrobiales bacterium]|nr:BsuPI-related putative proteinase inhibitor [Acidimicrobiales bacterium]